MRALRTQRFIVGGIALAVLSGIGFFVYSRNYEVSFSNVSSARSGRSVFYDTPWKEDIARFSKESQKQGRAFSPDTLNAKNPQNLTEQLASVFSKKMVSDPQFDIGKFSGKESLLSAEILKGLDQKNVNQIKVLQSLEPTLLLEKEIKISHDTSKAGLKKYLEQVQAVLSKSYRLQYPEVYKKEKVNDLDIINYAIINNDFREVQAIIEFDEDRIIALKEIVVPKKMSLLHRKLVTVYIHKTRLSAATKMLHTDPIFTLTALQKFRGLRELLGEISNDIAVIRQQEMISYAQ